MKEKEWDKKLHIDTIGCDASKEDDYHYPYEPTPYCVLERLEKSGYISNDNILVDYGCGKGRVGFYLNHQMNCSVIGIDFDERMCEVALENLRKFVSGFHLQKSDMPDKKRGDCGGFIVVKYVLCLVTILLLVVDAFIYFNLKKYIKVHENELVENHIKGLLGRAVAITLISVCVGVIAIILQIM